MSEKVATILSVIIICITYACIVIWYLYEFRKYFEIKLKKDIDIYRLHSYLKFHAILFAISIICSAIIMATEGFSVGPWLLDVIALIVFCITYNKGSKYFLSKCGEEI